MNKDKLEIIVWPYSDRNHKNKYWIVEKTDHGYFPIHGPYKTKTQARHRLDELKKEDK